MRSITPSNIRRRAGLAVVTFLLSLSAACNSSGAKAPDPEKVVEMHREQALGYYEQGSLLQAEDQIRRGLEIKPNDDQLKLMLGWCRQRRGTRQDLDVAERVFRDLAPRKDFRALLGLAECLERKGVLYREAADEIASGAKMTDAPDPQKRAKDLRDKSTAYWEEALINYQAVLAAKPSEGQAMNGLQRTYAYLGRSEESLMWADRLLVQSASEAKFWTEQLKRTDLRADEEARVRLRLNSSSELTIATHFSAASLLMRLGRTAEAIAHLDQIVLMSPRESGAYSRRAQLLFELGRYEEARANLDEYLRLSGLDFDHPDVQRAFQLQADCERRLSAQLGSAK
jgi:tetratricopeptide (TPR) repeat protein